MNWNELSWIELKLNELNWIELNSIALNRVESNRIEPNWIELVLVCLVLNIEELMLSKLFGSYSILLFSRPIWYWKNLCKMAAGQFVLSAPLCFLHRKHGKLHKKRISNEIVNFYPTEVLIAAKEQLVKDTDAMKLDSMPRLPRRRDCENRDQREGLMIFFLSSSSPWTREVLLSSCNAMSTITRTTFHLTGYKIAICASCCPSWKTWRRCRRYKIWYS